MEKQEQQLDEDEDERRTRRAELGRPGPPSVVDELFERLTTLSSKLQSAVELSSLFQAQHAAAQSTISALESKGTSLESLVKAQATPPPPAIEEPESTEPHPSESLIQVLADWKTSAEGQWFSVREEWASESERLSSAREE
jgi:hypothetical protein